MVKQSKIAINTFQDEKFLFNEDGTVPWCHCDYRDELTHLCH